MGPGGAGGLWRALTCRREPLKPAVIRGAWAEQCGVGSRGAGTWRGKVWKSDTNANVLPSKSPWSSQLKFILNFPPQAGGTRAGAPSRFPHSQAVILSPRCSRVPHRTAETCENLENVLGPSTPSVSPGSALHSGAAETQADFPRQFCLGFCSPLAIRAQSSSHPRCDSPTTVNLTDCPVERGRIESSSPLPSWGLPCPC